MEIFRALRLLHYLSRPGIRNGPFDPTQSFLRWPSCFRCLVGTIPKRTGPDLLQFLMSFSSSFSPSSSSSISVSSNSDSSSSVVWLSDGSAPLCSFRRRLVLLYRDILRKTSEYETRLIRYRPDFRFASYGCDQ